MRPLFITALFTIAKIWKQPKCPLTDKWIKRIRYMDTMEYYPAIKNQNRLLQHMDTTKIKMCHLQHMDTTKVYHTN